MMGLLNKAQQIPITKKDKGIRADLSIRNLNCKFYNPFYAD
jgi:hypothetical protein